ncbi:MAG: Cache 3/Cache 2 fusion domain-containing protein [Candidatus Eremiobacteraeota bacterium]|nr:Cache 3/Cache 2 fusion domain-containing protein [Candidatus Eremiobacteraeota bacterium]
MLGRSLHFGNWIANEDVQIVDQVKAITGCDATIYQKAGDRFVAIATTFDAGGRRATGAELTGSPRSAIADGRAFQGTTKIAGSDYVAEYEPLVDAAGTTVGVTFTGKPATALVAAAAVTVLQVTVISLGALIVILFLVFLVVRNIRRDAFRVATVARALASGVLDETAQVRSRNELGEIASAFDEMIAYQREMAGSAETIASGNLAKEIVAHAPDDRLGNALAQMSANLSALVRQIQRTADTLALSSAELGATSSQSSAMVAEATVAMASVARGYDALSDSAATLDRVVRQFSIGIEAIARGAVDQAAQVNVASKDASKMFEDVERVARISGTLAASGLRTKNAASNGERAVAETVEQMSAIADVVRGATEKIRELEALTAAIGSIVEAIDEIAEQTNLLALNASIEASRAGEHGRGFAVVAAEVRKLAERSASENKQIGELVRQVQERTRETVVAVDEGAEKVVSGTRQAAVGGAALREILQSVEQTVHQVAEISKATEVMARSAKSVMESIQSINLVIEEYSTATEAMAVQTSEITESIGEIAATSAQHRAEAEHVARISFDVRNRVDEVQEQAIELDETARALRQLTSRFTTEERGQHDGEPARHLEHRQVAEAVK